MAEADKGQHELSEDFCLGRQEAIREALRAIGCPALLVRDRGQLTRLFNHRAREVFPAAALIPSDGPSVICRMEGSEGRVFAGEERRYEAAFLSSLRPRLSDLAVQPLLELIPKGSQLGLDGDLPLALYGQVEPVDMQDRIIALRRAKDPDEIALIAAGVAASEAAYIAVEPLLIEGMREIDVFAAFQAAAVSAAGQPIGELGNDFRARAIGGAPRREPLRSGDMIPIDTGVMIHGYYSDLCRSYSVGGHWSEAQLDAAWRVAGAHDLALSMITSGVSCRAVYHEVSRYLEGYRGWRFGMHLGHGIGLNPVESPRINPHWDDYFEAGDVFTLEPGLYGADLRQGIRIENDYVLTETGIRALSDSVAILPPRV